MPWKLLSFVGLGATAGLILLMFVTVRVKDKFGLSKAPLAEIRVRDIVWDWVKVHILGREEKPGIVSSLVDVSVGLS